MQIPIRRANPDDAPALTALALRSKQSNGYDDAFMAACVEELTVTPALIASETYFVAQNGSATCGMACLSEGRATGSGVIHAFFVDPDFKRRGVGRNLWAAILSECANRSLTHLHLDADPAAVPFYRALGFEITKMVPSGSIAGRELPRMAMEIYSGRSNT